MDIQNERPAIPELEENGVLTAGGPIDVTMEGDRTAIRLGRLKDRYKLSKAYENIRNLEILTDKETDRQTFSKYLDLRAEIHPGRARIIAKPRPRYPSDESYRNTRLTHLYSKGNMLVLVDNQVYSQVQKSIDQYVLDVGRDGVWATVHVVQGGTPADCRVDIRRRRGNLRAAPPADQLRVAPAHGSG